MNNKRSDEKLPGASNKSQQYGNKRNKREVDKEENSQIVFNFQNLQRVFENHWTFYKLPAE